MKLQTDTLGARFLIEAYTENTVKINGILYQTSLLLHPEEGPRPWPVCQIADLEKVDWSPLLTWKPSVFLLGTGKKPDFTARAYLNPLYKVPVGVEILSNSALYRTYQALVSEGRNVVAGIIYI